MASAATGGDPGVSIGRVFGQAFGTIAANPVVTLGIAFVFGAVPSGLLNYGMQYLPADGFGSSATVAALAVGAAWIVVSILFGMISQGAMVRATVAHSEGRKASFGESAKAGLHAALPLFVVGLLSGLGIVVGLIFLVVPGIMLYIIWTVAAPALVEERLGPVEALDRSRELTRGARWTIFGLSLVIVVVYWIFSAAVTIVMLIWSGSMSNFSVLASQEDSIFYLAFNAVVQTITSAVWGTILSSLYIELRDWKDGPESARLADIFA